MTKGKFFISKRVVIPLILIVFICIPLNAQKIDKIETKKVFKIARDLMMEKVMVSLERKDIFIIDYDLKAGTIVTEFKEISRNRMQVYTEMNLLNTEFDIYRYQVKTMVSEVGQESSVEIRTVLKAYGRPGKYLGARPGWYTLPSNGKLEAEVMSFIKLK